MLERFNNKTLGSFSPLSVVAAILLVTLPALAHAKVQYINTPFNDSASRVQPSYSGVNPTALVNELAKSPMPVKGKFETSSDLQHRIDAWQKKKIIGSITPESLIAFVFNPSTNTEMSIAYDADTEEVTFKINPSICLQPNQLSLSSSMKQNETYIGSNAFGGKAIVKKYQKITQCLSNIDTGIDIKAHIPRNQAVNHVPHLRVLITGVMWAPYLSSRNETVSPTFAAPTEIDWRQKTLSFLMDDLWIFNSESGEVIYRHQPSFSKIILTTTATTNSTP